MRIELYEVVVLRRGLGRGPRRLLLRLRVHQDEGQLGAQFTVHNNIVLKNEYFNKF